MTGYNIEPLSLMIATGEHFKILSKMAASEKVHMILTKYFRDINQEHYVIYLQNMKFV